MQDQPSTATLRQLPVAERIMLVQDLWDSIAEHPDELELSEEHKQLLDSRLEAYHQNPQAGSPWEQVKARILKRQ
jgi:putative addiction module component (TIGR02574 family)